MQLDAIDSHARESRFIGLDPRVKTISLLGLAVTTALLVDTGAVILSLVFALSLSAGSGLPARHIARRIAYLLPFSVFAFLSILPFRGFLPGLLLLIRVLACGIYLIVLSSVTPFFDLIRALGSFGFPKILSDMVFFLYRYIFVFSDELERMSKARKARSFKGGRSLLDRYGLTSISSTAGMILFRAYSRGLAVNRALTARGYSAQVKATTAFKVGADDVVFLSASVGAILLLVLVQLGVIV